MKKRFTITYDIVTEESSIHGDSAYNGYLTRNQTTPRRRNSIPKNPATWTLREAVEFLEDKRGQGVECDSCPWSPAHPPHWINFSGELEDGECTSFSLHSAIRGFERGTVTGASMCRIARLFKAYGEHK